MIKTPFMDFALVDVFADKILNGNSLAVFFLERPLAKNSMQNLAREMRQYESIFLSWSKKRHHIKARVFTVREELDFAGHPLLGAAVAIHERVKLRRPTSTWIFELRKKSVEVRVEKKANPYYAEMEQGVPTFGPRLSSPQTDYFLKHYGLRRKDLYPGLLPRVVSTGLPYLILPVRNAIHRVVPSHKDLTPALREIGAMFVYILDVAKKEGRTWDNLGNDEDIATGSAAGPSGAFLFDEGLLKGGALTLSQGRFLKRPSRLFVAVRGARGAIESIRVGGGVVPCGLGTVRI